MRSIFRLLALAATVVALVVVVPSALASSPHTLTITKECSQYTGANPSFCTITTGRPRRDGDLRPKRLLRRFASNPSFANIAVWAFGILEVEARRSAGCGGRRVDLTKLEFEMLNYLCQRPGKVVERSALLRDVWGYDYAGGSNVIEVVITSTRRKLGSRAGAIETVRGLGYRFVASA